MRILGVDPGITRCGLGVVDVDITRRVKMVHVEVARSSTELAAHFRLRNIHRKICDVIDTYQPDVVSVERVFAQENVQSVTTTMWVMGVALQASAERGLPVAIHTPSEVKAAVTGSGVAGKAQVQEMVKRILGLDKIIRPADAADALAIAICHAWRGDGLLGEGKEGVVNVSISGKITAKGKLTPAQQQWAQAQADLRRKGAADPRLRSR